MKRTIEVHNNNAYYQGKKLDYIAQHMRRHFQLENSRTFKYVITITKGSTYRISRSCGDYDLYDAHNNYIGLACIVYADKIFGKIEDGHYDITVKKVRK